MKDLTFIFLNVLTNSLSTKIKSVKKESHFHHNLWNFSSLLVLFFLIWNFRSILSMYQEFSRTTASLKMIGRNALVTKTSLFLLMVFSWNLALGNQFMRKYLFSVLELFLNVSQIFSFLHLYTLKVSMLSRLLLGSRDSSKQSGEETQKEVI